VKPSTRPRGTLPLQGFCARLPDTAGSESPAGPYSASHRPGRVVFPLISPFSSAMTLIERYRPVTTQRFALSSNSWPCGHLTPRPAVTQRLVLSSNSWPCGHLTPRPAVTQRLVLSSNSWPCGHLTPRPAVTQRFVLSSNSWPCGHLTPCPAATQRFSLWSNSWPCGHLWAGPTPPNPTHLFSTGTNTWPGGQLPCAAAGVETKFAATNIAANTRPAPRRKPNAAVFLPMAQPPFDEPRTARSSPAAVPSACLMRYSFLRRP
jgi:hypothetical protein